MSQRILLEYFERHGILPNPSQAEELLIVLKPKKLRTFCSGLLIFLLRNVFNWLKKFYMKKEAQD